MKILYVEDNPLDIELTRLALKKSAPQLHIDAVGSLKEALETFKGTDFSDYDLVLTDMRLPDGDGIALLSHIRGHSLPVAVVVLTGQGDEETAVAALKAGADDYVIKKTGYLEKLPLILENALLSHRKGNVSTVHSLNVLYMEHNQVDVDLTLRHFKKHAPHIHVVPVYSVSDFYGMLQGTDPFSGYDVLLIDYRLPMENAMEILNRIRLKRGLKIPVVMVTGKGDEEIAVNALKLGAFDYVIKNRGYLFKLPSVIENAFHSNEMKRGYAALKASEAKYKNIVDHIGIGIVIIDTDMKVRSVNNQMEKWHPDLDMEQNPICFKSFHGPSRRRPCESCPAVETFKDGLVHKSTMKTGDEPDCKYLRIISTPVKDEEDRVTSAVVLIDDITEMQRAQEERLDLEIKLQQTQKMEAIGTLAGGIAHDFNNILSSIMGYTELALDDLEDKSLLGKHLEKIYAGGKRAGELVNQILTFSRSSDDRKKPVQVSAILKETLKLLRSAIPMDVEIVHHMESDSWIMGSPTKIHQVVMNLCTNAAQAMGKDGGVLEITLREMNVDDEFGAAIEALIPGTYLELRVTDTGTGISPEIRDKIFEPYFTTKAPGRGTGFGLAVTHGIVKNMGGAIRVESVLGKGSDFSIYLPVSKANGVAEKREIDDIPKGTERILLVDDEPTITEMTGQILEKLGYRVDMMNDSLNALALFRETPRVFDLVITDMTMPHMNGDQLSREILKINPHTPVILVTGYSSRISREKAIRIGIRAFAQKPLLKADLGKMVRAVLDQRNPP